MAAPPKCIPYLLFTELPPADLAQLRSPHPPSIIYNTYFIHSVVFNCICYNSMYSLFVCWFFQISDCHYYFISIVQFSFECAYIQYSLKGIPYTACHYKLIRSKQLSSCIPSRYLSSLTRGYVLNCIAKRYCLVVISCRLKISEHFNAQMRNGSNTLFS